MLEVERAGPKSGLANVTMASECSRVGARPICRDSAGIGDSRDLMQEAVPGQGC